MEVIDRIRSLCKQEGISIPKLEKELGFSNGSLAKAKTIPSTRILAIAERFGVTSEYLLTGKKDDYYINPDTAKVAQEIFENKELRLLFDAARDAKPEDLETTRAMLLALKRKEMGE